MSGEPKAPQPSSDDTGKNAQSPVPVLRQTGLAGVLRASTSGEGASVRGILASIGGVRGIAEAIVPALSFLVVFVITQDAKVSVIAPIALSVIAVAARLIARQPSMPAISGLLGVGVCVVTTLISGKGEDYFLPGFFINGAWVLGLLISLCVRWPLIGVMMGALQGSLTEWRNNPQIRRAAVVCTWIWLGLFTARLAVQLPLFFAAEAGQSWAFEALGLARIVMGVPLFALTALFTWLVLNRVTHTEASSAEPDSTVIRSS